jgi:DNA-binding beta-propeller fold protein YncE
VKGAKEGIIVAGEQSEGNSLIQLDDPYGVVVDHLGQVYVADSNNHQIIRWSKGSKEGQIIVGGNGEGSEPEQLEVPMNLSFDRQGNLYVADFGNNRVQKFDVDLN